MKNQRPTCRRCHTPMTVGKALQNEWAPMNPAARGLDGVTLSPNPRQVKMVECWKCPKCGHSITA